MVERVGGDGPWPRGVRHGFTTRAGGVSVGDLASLNLARRPAEDPDALGENWRRAVDAVAGDLPVSRVAVVNQVHGARVIVVEAPGGPVTPLGDADALVTTQDDVVLAIRVADCVPIVVAGPRAIAAIHAGWRGVVADVVGAAIAAMRASGDDGPWVAAVGPHASAAAYEVGDEVVAGLLGAGIPRATAVAGTSARGRARVDLGASVAWQLRRAGVGHVAATGGCTVSEARFFSHRRDGDTTGRMAALIVRRGGG